MLHLQNPNIPAQEAKSFLSEGKPVQIPSKSLLLEEIPFKTKPKKVINKENISPNNRPYNKKTTKHRTAVQESEKNDLNSIQNQNKCFHLQKDNCEENYLKAFLKEMMPEKNPMLLVNKFIDQIKQTEFEMKAMNPLILAKIVDRNEEYDKLYGSSLEKKMFEDEPDYEDLLKNTKIADGLRAKMVDWMLEIFSKYPEMCSNETYFKAVAIFHLYIKKSFAENNKILTDSDIHLAGIASMFLASKYEDESHIQLKDFVTLIGHSAFSMSDIKEKEWEIYSILNLNLTFPTSYSFLNFFFYRSFGNENSMFSSNLYEIALYILKLSNYLSTLVEVRPHLLTVCCLLYSIKLMFNGLKELKCCNFFEIEKKMIDNVLSVCGDIDLKQAKECIENINSLIGSWENLFPRLMNIQKAECELNS